MYRCAKQQSEPSSDKRGARVDELHLTPQELIARIAALVPPPRTHRHRYFDVLAPNSPLRAAAVALATPAQPAKQVVVQTEPAATGECAPGVVVPGNAVSLAPEPAPPKRSKAHYLRAVLIARICEVFPLLWEDGDAQTDEGAQIDPADWDLAAQPAPDFEVDQRVSW